jgi:hypothetical protein
MEPLRAAALRPVRPSGWELRMLDLLLLALGVGFFALMVAYAAGCERV